MRNRQIWLVIACILVVGAAVTFYTKSFGSREMGEAAAETSQVQETSAAVAMARAAAAAETEAAPSPEEAKTAQEAALAAPAAPTAASASQAQRAPRSPALPLEGRSGQAEGGPSSGMDYRRRLEELDRQVSQLEEEGAGANVYSAQTSAALQLKLWESEMNNIYSALLEELPEGQASSLAEEQQEWLKERDIKAAGNDGSSSALKGVEYTNALVELTRERAYQLADRYENLHNGELNQTEAEAGQDG